MVLAQKQSYQSIKQNKEARNKLTYLCSINLQQMLQEYAVEKHSLSKCFLENWTATCKRMKLQHTIKACNKINSKCIEDKNVRPEAIKLSGENRQNMLT